MSCETGERCRLTLSRLTRVRAQWKRHAVYCFTAAGVRQEVTRVAGALPTPSNASGGDGGTSVRVCLRLRFPRGRTLVAASLLLLACSVSQKTQRCFALTFMKTTLLPQNFRFQLPNFQLFHIKPHRVCSKSSFILQGL